MTGNPLNILAQAAESWQSRELSEAVEHDTRRAVLDFFAALLPGCVEAPAVAVAQALRTGRGTGEAVSYVDEGRTATRHAALLNGTASHTVEFDDIFRDGGYHPGSPTISAALAVAQAEDAGAERFHRAIIGGYEVGCRIALALQPSHYRNWHITATVGTIGAAVSTAMLKRCDAEAIGHAIAIATSFAGGHQENLQGRGLTKPLHCGHAAEAGVLAGLAAAEGVTGSPDSLHAPHGYAAATSDSTGNWTAGLEGLGKWTPISRMTFKNHGCCGHIFPTLDAICAMQKTHGFKPDDIERIDILGYGPTVSICDRMDVSSARDARFSIQYCTAALFLTSAVRLSAFKPDTLGRSDIRNFMAKVRVAEDAEIAAAYPAKRQAHVSITFHSGEVIDHFQPTRKGDPDDPLTDAELLEKYDELSAVVLTPEDSARLRDVIMTSDRLPGDLIINACSSSEA
ncbi:MmgE/PrpD family protein [Notoacmeibacter sp. MSK16QG-6]|uniref:MmgE/PrpD family protein n=1 Tax=Notoacmeibacter sp. MSK16QG-6 TaxID=2957982 RepID=UPI0020A02F5F|nr:MmgE/PrpD family protein [Notoacmeibacter sp. MSK16QG-6]MCP1200565.1 MmgE/PrpD family protein [Notoacmeibacter sp. MSK16QG-6]